VASNSEMMKQQRDPTTRNGPIPYVAILLPTGNRKTGTRDIRSVFISSLVSETPKVIWVGSEDRRPRLSTAKSYT
jgi:hypothetical protein